jgi:hypothetical protein
LLQKERIFFFQKQKKQKEENLPQRLPPMVPPTERLDNFRKNRIEILASKKISFKEPWFKVSKGYSHIHICMQRTSNEL